MKMKELAIPSRLKVTKNVCKYDMYLRVPLNA